jgi:hypothetical protein
MHTTAATRMSVGLRLLFQPEGCLRMLDNTPTGINPKPVEVLVVHVLAALMQVAFKVKQHTPASQSLTGFNCSRYKQQVPEAYIKM